MNINPKVVEAIRNSVYHEDTKGYWHMKTCALARKDYEQFKRIILAARGEWKRSVDAHVFTYNPKQQLEKILSTGQLPEANPHSFHPTPIEEIESCLDWMQIPKHEPVRFLEPSAGDGRMARVILDRYPLATVDCYEIDPCNQEILKAQGLNVLGDDFLKAKTPAIYNYVLMNPPFNGKEYQKHIRKAYDCLLRHGKLCSIVPISFRQDKKFRNWVFECGESAIVHSEFETTDTKCASILVPADRGDYHTFIRDMTIITLDSTSSFYTAVNKAKTPEQIAECIDKAVEDIIMKWEDDIYFGEEVRSQVIAHYTAELLLEVNKE